MLHVRSAEVKKSDGCDVTRPDKEIAALLKTYEREVKYWDKKGISANANRYRDLCELLRWVMGTGPIAPS